MPENVAAQAPAKVNLVLEVLGKREDGYHEIDTVLQTLALADRVILRFDSGFTRIDVMGPCADGTPADETNLAIRAARELAKLTGRDFGHLHWTIDKRTPPAGGLGGGASDAATALRLLQRAWPDIRDSQLLAAANAIGSDEAFFLLGGTARATGRGEHVTPLPALPEHGVVLFVPPATLERKTARLFAALDVMPFDDGSVARAFAGQPKTPLRGADIFNAFERVAFDVFPGLATLWEELETRIGEPIHLAGAGPTLFWIGPVAETDAVAARAQGLACTVIPTRTSASLWRP